MKHLTGGKHLQVLLFRQSFPVLAAESLVMELEVDGKRLEIHVVNCILWATVKLVFQGQIYHI